MTTYNLELGQNAFMNVPVTDSCEICAAVATCVENYCDKVIPIENPQIEWKLNQNYTKIHGSLNDLIRACDQRPISKLFRVDNVLYKTNQEKTFEYEVHGNWHPRFEESIGVVNAFKILTMALKDMAKSLITKFSNAPLNSKVIEKYVRKFDKITETLTQLALEISKNQVDVPYTMQPTDTVCIKVREYKMDD